MELKEENVKAVYNILFKCFKTTHDEKTALNILGKEDEFKEKIEEVRKELIQIGEENVPLYLQSVTIFFPSSFFKKLFYEYEIGKDISKLGHIELNNSIFVEYKDSTALRMIKRLKQHSYRNIKFDGKSIDIFIDPEGKHYLDYEEFYDYIIYTLKLRELSIPVVSSKKEYEISDFLKPIFYLVRVDKDIDYILPSLNYHFAKYLGISPINNKDLPETVVFDLPSQNINIFHNEIDKLLRKTKGTQAINYYLKALNEPDPLYQFLDFYHIIETFCYDYIWDYYTNLKKEPKEKFEELINLKKNNLEEKLIKKTFVILQERYVEKFKTFKATLDKLNGENKNEDGKLNKFIKKLNKNISGNKIPEYKNWDNKGYFENLGRFIFKIRSEIAHRKIQKNPITSYATNYHDVISEINKIMKEIAETIIEEKELLMNK